MTLHLTPVEQGMLEGAEGPGVALAMRIVTGLARVRGADELVEVSGTHIDSCLFHGRAGLDFAERLVELGATVRVPTTLNVGSLDLLHPGTVRADAEHPDLLTSGRALMDAYLALGARPTWTCAPYQVDSRPAVGGHVAWAESNAIVFANSVLGARTDRYGDFLDICAAITGRAPRAGFHLDEERLASLVVDVREVPETRWSDEAWYAVLGYLLGAAARSRVAAVVGLPSRTSEDDLKALGAAAASSGGIGLFHAVGITPEAPSLEAVLGPRDPEVLTIGEAQLNAGRRELSTASGGRIDAISLGTPHASLREFQSLAAELERTGTVVAPSVNAYISTGRGVLALAEAAGYVATIEAAGFRIVADTCTYLVPILPDSARVVMTNSGKWAHYAPGNLGLQVVLGTLAECVAAAGTGTVVLDD